MIDIYFDKDYGKLYEHIEDGEVERFEYNSSLGRINHMFIKREIPIKIDNKIYYDLVTPYGYGGPIITSVINKDNARKKLVEDFRKSFNRYCIDNNIVSEFVRFHPLTNNAIDFENCYSIEHIRNTVGTNLKDFENPFESEFSKSCRKNIRKALKNGVDYKVTENPSNISDFKEIYYSTMMRNNANSYYYFDEEYFNMCLKLFGKNILLVEAIYEEKTIAMGFYFTYDKRIHIHLSGTYTDYLFLSPAYILRYAVTLWGKENGYEMIHHGGGRTNDPNDTLYLFKKQFGKNTEFEFYTGKKVWNESIYNELSKITGTDSNTDYFPVYRAK